MSTPRTRVYPDQQTPVIIKIGGDSDLASAAAFTQVSISSEVMSFRDSSSGPTWERAHSTRNGRINEITIVIGDDPQDFPIEPDDQLVSLTIEFGADKLILKESGERENVTLVIVSEEVPFKSKEADWKKAVANFSKGVTGIQLFKGETPIVEESYMPPNSNFALSVDFRRNVE